MQLYVEEKLSLRIDPVRSQLHFLSHFRSKPAHVRDQPFPRPKEPYEIQIRLVRATSPHRIVDALSLIRDQNLYGFLSPYELLYMDFIHTELQMRKKIVTPLFTLGVSSNEIPTCATRQIFGRVLDRTVYDPEVWVESSDTWYALKTHQTLVDQIRLDRDDDFSEYEAWLDSYFQEIFGPLHIR